MKALLALFAFSLLPSAYAAPASGSGSGIRGGGKGIVCRDSAGKPTSVELLDLWESRSLYNRPPLRSNSPLPEQVRAALLTLKDADLFYFGDEKFIEKNRQQDFETYMARAADFFPEEKKTNPVTVQRLRNSTIALTDDSFEEAWPAGCKVEQIVAYKQWNTGAIIYVNQDLFDAMDTLNQAALIVHEAVYSSFKFRLEPNSVRIRRAVGYAFAGGSFAQTPDPAKRHISCQSREKQFFVNVSLFENTANGKLESFTHRDEYRMSLGYFPAPVISMLNQEPNARLESLIAPTQCDWLKKHGHAIGFVLLGGGGPVDFDRNSMLVLSCPNASLEVRYSANGYPEGDTSALPELQCKLVEGK